MVVKHDGKAAWVSPLPAATAWSNPKDRADLK